MLSNGDPALGICVLGLVHPFPSLLLSRSHGLHVKQEQPWVIACPDLSAPTSVPVPMDGAQWDSCFLFFHWTQVRNDVMFIGVVLVFYFLSSVMSKICFPCGHTWPPNSLVQALPLSAGLSLAGASGFLSTGSVLCSLWTRTCLQGWGGRAWSDPEMSNEAIFCFVQSDPHHQGLAWELPEFCSVFG